MTFRLWRCFCLCLFLNITLLTGLNWCGERSSPWRFLYLLLQPLPSSSFSTSLSLRRTRRAKRQRLGRKLLLLLLASSCVSLFLAASDFQMTSSDQMILKWTQCEKEYILLHKVINIWWWICQEITRSATRIYSRFSAKIYHDVSWKYDPSTVVNDWLCCKLPMLQFWLFFT